ncbi:DUF973 family protein [Saccharolobus solfataricus]|uniref:Uncharacterized protein n=3 Tax=Saccharolobus solfataricus TaxID=2287 RepID=Q97XV4_SACS2|nr:Hypothetical protein SSO8462 [Saccharolobus solfataricus P2]PVU76606.1 DUF973 domain-containing protein [Sulfolobus islandicus]QPG48800.1 DUF973 family protein [Saccharolobus solfataricus]SAI85283.1 uncharacterised protein [Saccharolobus solfataricus]
MAILVDTMLEVWPKGLLLNAPVKLNPANNNVTVIFPPLSGMIPKNNYNLILTLSNGQSIKIVVIYKI